MTSTTDLPGELIEAAKAAGMHDTGDLALADLSKLERDASGRFRNADAFVRELHEAKPHLFSKPVPKHARDMSKAELDAHLRELDRRHRAAQDKAVLDRMLADLAQKRDRSRG